MLLYLRAPLFFKRTGLKEKDLLKNFQINEEIILCYNVNPNESKKIEPVTEQFLGSLVFTGVNNGQETLNTDAVSLPKGEYLFVQQRSALASEDINHPEWLEMAIEQQKDGLWERNKLGDTLYVRYLYEDEAYVVQVFRTVIYE